MKSFLQEILIFLYITFIFFFIVGIFYFNTNYSFEQVFTAPHRGDFLFYIKIVSVFFFFFIGKSTYLLILPFFIIAIALIFRISRLYKIAGWLILDAIIISAYFSLYSSSALDLVQGGIVGNLISGVFVPLFGKIIVSLFLGIVIGCSLIQVFPSLSRYFNLVEKYSIEQILNVSMDEQSTIPEKRKMWNNMPIPTLKDYKNSLKKYDLDALIKYNKEHPSESFLELLEDPSISAESLKSEDTKNTTYKELVLIQKNIDQVPLSEGNYLPTLLKQNILKKANHALKAMFDSLNNTQNQLINRFNSIVDTNYSFNLEFVGGHMNVSTESIFLESDDSLTIKENETNFPISANLIDKVETPIIEKRIETQTVFTEVIEVPPVITPEVFENSESRENIVDVYPSTVIEAEHIPKKSLAISFDKIESESKNEQIKNTKEDLLENYLETDPIQKTEKILEKQTENILNENNKTEFNFPLNNLLSDYDIPDTSANKIFTEEVGGKVLDILKEFNISAILDNIIIGPVATRYEIIPPKGVKISKITDLADNITLGIASQDKVRIEAPVYGKSVVGIEVPNKIREMVPFKYSLKESISLVNTDNYYLPFLLGKALGGDTIVQDITKMPHLLVAGSTGAGKSVCINTLIHSLLFFKNPDELKMILVDPKRVELVLYNDLPHLITPVIKEVSQATKALKWLVGHMEERYSLLEMARVRNIVEYNNLQKQQGEKVMPYIVLVIDEFADLILIGKKEIEEPLIRLAAMARAVGIHIILATQRPSADVITGLIKANFPSRIAFRVSSKIESRIILDENGAENLLGKGDMLFMGIEQGSLIQRIQAPFLSDEEVRKVTDYFKNNYEINYWDEILENNEESEGHSHYDANDEPLFKEAIAIVLQDKKASASYLQRRLKVGYNRAARMIEVMEDLGIVGKIYGNKPREILVTSWGDIVTDTNDDF